MPARRACNGLFSCPAPPCMGTLGPAGLPSVPTLRRSQLPAMRDTDTPAGSCPFPENPSMPGEATAARPPASQPPRRSPGLRGAYQAARPHSKPKARGTARPSGIRRRPGSL